MPYRNPIPSLNKRITYNSENESDYIPLNEVYFSFIDVLGFKKAFDDMKISQKTEFIDTYREVFNYYFTLMNAARFMETGKDTGCYAGQTSDSLYFYTNRSDYLLEFIKIFSHFSLYAMSKNVFFRGGIAKGKLYTKEMYQFYGDSVIGAYLLESNISRNPVIVIDEQTHFDMLKVDGYKEFVSNYSQERHIIKPFKYLYEKAFLDIYDKESLKIIDAAEIKKNILANKKLFEYDANNYAKYSFLLEEYTKVEEKLK